VLRRFETYALDARTDRRAPPAVPGLEMVLRACPDHIPEVEFNVVGWNRSDAPVHVVWEHAFASVEAYRRYMVHPYHAAVIDRFVLSDSPERVVVDDAFGAGLFGYRCEGAPFRLERGLRRVVLLRVDRGVDEARVRRFTGALERAAGEPSELVLSVVAANSLGGAWFDGVTPVGPPPRWTHVWEQGFASWPALGAYRAGGSTLAEVERAGGDGWATWSSGVVRTVAELVYDVDGSGV